MVEDVEVFAALLCQCGGDGAVLTKLLLHHVADDRLGSELIGCVAARCLQEFCVLTEELRHELSCDSRGSVSGLRRRVNQLFLLKVVLELTILKEAQA